MQTQLELVLDDLELSVPSVRRALELSNRRIESGRRHLVDSGVTCQSGDILAFGSLARREATDESDFDYLVLVDGIPEDPDAPGELLRRADHLRTIWAVEQGHQGDQADLAVKKPGTSGLFATVVGAFDLIEQVGLERDTNHSLTRRMLLLEESVSLFNAYVRTRVVSAALDRYLVLPGVRPEATPRYLLNDVIRYWRTVSVDYQAKANALENSGLRYVKLLIPRKIQFASMLMSLLLCGRLDGHRATRESLSAQLDLPPLARLLAGAAVARREVRESMRQVATIMDWYLEKSADGAWRSAVGERPINDHNGTEEYEEARVKAKQLQLHLEVIFFEWDLVSHETRSKLVF